MLRCASCRILENVSGINSSTVAWYASRATGVVALLLMTAVVLLGLVVTRQGRLPGLPRFAVTGLHRNLSLVAVVFVALHVLTAITDTYVHIPLAAAVIPLASSYERLWIGLGAVSLDITIALIVTSLLRRHLSRRLWRAVHLLAYASWPVAWLHSITSSTDLRRGWMFLMAVACALLVMAAVGWRLSAASRDVPRAERVGLLMAAVHSRTSLRDRLAGRGTEDNRDPRGPRGTPPARTARGGTVPMEPAGLRRQESRVTGHERISRR
jgi:sulfoxide reductase heme-binding subunit YedZ